MTNMKNVERRTWRNIAAFLVLALGLHGPGHGAGLSLERKGTQTTMNNEQRLSTKQQVIAPIGAFMAAGEMAKLDPALHRALDAGLTISEIKEILVQLYAYVGFPRSLNALGAFMQVVEARAARGIRDAAGQEPGRPLPTGDALLAAGTANQTRLSGAPVTGPLFEFAPAIDRFLKTHLFGDIFERDNLDWQSRELATLGALSALTGVESQLQAHIRIGMNTGLSAAQLSQAADVLEKHGAEDAARRLAAALGSQRKEGAKP